MYEITDKIALIDLDGTVADYDLAMTAQMKSLQAPDEPLYNNEIRKPDEKEPAHIEQRRKLIQNQPGFWRNLQEIKLGFDIVRQLKAIGFELHVLSKGPSKAPPAWSEKVEWCLQHLPDIPIEICTEKSLTYGRVLVDDWPPYFQKWLAVRKRGLVVCVAQPWNADINDWRVVRYTGDNILEVVERLLEAYTRPAGA